MTRGKGHVNHSMDFLSCIIHEKENYSIVLIVCTNLFIQRMTELECSLRRPKINLVQFKAGSVFLFTQAVIMRSLSKEREDEEGG